MSKHNTKKLTIVSYIRLICLNKDTIKILIFSQSINRRVNIRCKIRRIKTIDHFQIRCIIVAPPKYMNQYFGIYSFNIMILIIPTKWHRIILKQEWQFLTFSVFKHLSASTECRAASLAECFKILDTAHQTEYQIKLKEAMHVKWLNAVLNHQVTHVNLSLSLYFCFSLQYTFVRTHINYLNPLTIILYLTDDGVSNFETCL